MEAESWKPYRSAHLGVGRDQGRSIPGRRPQRLGVSAQSREHGARGAVGAFLRTLPPPASRKRRRSAGPDGFLRATLRTVGYLWGKNQCECSTTRTMGDTNPLGMIHTRFWATITPREVAQREEPHRSEHEETTDASHDAAHDRASVRV